MGNLFENMYYNLSEKPDAKYMFMVSVKDIKAGEEITLSYPHYQPKKKSKRRRTKKKGRK